MKNSLIRIPLIILGLAIVASILWNVYRPQPSKQIVAPITDTTTPLCYYRSDKVAGKPIGKIDCDELNEIVVVEKYIRDNIATIATDKPVLGGTWYATSVVADAQTHIANVTYEDGHIQSKATVEYTFEKEGSKITITKFTPVK